MAAETDGFVYLTLAIVYQAIRDLRTKNAALSQDARNWLLTTAPNWLDAAGVDIDLAFWREWVDSGCPERVFRKKRLKV